MSQKTLCKSDAPKNISSTEKELNENDFIVSKTDTKGKIIYCNEIFTKMSGYQASSLIGANHNLIRHPDMPRLAFALAWELIQNSKEFFGLIKNLCADGSFYWVFAYITADLDANGRIISYTSVRRKVPKSAIEIIAPLYKELVSLEKSGGIEASKKALNTYLAQKKMSYDEFIINLEKGAQI